MIELARLQSNTIFSSKDRRKRSSQEDREKMISFQIESRLKGFQYDTFFASMWRLFPAHDLREKTSSESKDSSHFHLQ